MQVRIHSASTIQIEIEIEIQIQIEIEIESKIVTRQSTAFRSPTSQQKKTLFLRSHVRPQRTRQQGCLAKAAAALPQSKETFRPSDL